MPNLTAAPLQGVAEGGLAAVALVGLLALAADVLLGDPLAPEADPQPAQHGAVGQALVAVLPAHDAQHVVEPVLDDPRIDERHRQGPVSARPSAA